MSSGWSWFRGGNRPPTRKAGLPTSSRVTEAQSNTGGSEMDARKHRSSQSLASQQHRGRLDQTAHLVEQMRNLQKENYDLKEQQTESNKQIADFTDELNYYTQVNEDLERTVSAIREECTTLKDTTRQKDEAWERNRSSLIEEANQIIRNVNMEVDELTGKLQDSRKSETEAKRQMVEVRNQNIELKTSITIAGILPHQITDSVVHERMKTLGLNVQGWVISSFRRSSPVATNLSKETVRVLSDAVPTFVELVHDQKFQVCQGVTMKSLCSVFETHSYYGLPSTGSLAGVEALAKRLEKTCPNFHRWRALTYGSIKDMEDKKDIDQNTLRLAKQIAGNITSSLEELLAVQISDSQAKKLAKIIDAAIELSRDLSIQRAMYQVAWPLRGDQLPVQFDASTMEVDPGSDVGGRMSDQVILATLPGVFKIGDANGDNMDTVFPVSKAWVLCGRPSASVAERQARQETVREDQTMVEEDDLLSF